MMAVFAIEPRAVRVRAALPRATVLATIACIAASVGSPANAADATPARYTLDQAKSTLDFTFEQAGAQNKGKFSKFPVTLDFSADRLPASKLDVVVDTTTIDSGDKERDDTLRGTDLMATTKFPQARFTSTQITKTATGYDAVGKLTIHGVTRDAHIPFAFRTADEQGKPVGYLTGKTSIKRLDFGVGQGDWKSTEWVGADVTVSYSLRLVAAR